MIYQVSSLNEPYAWIWPTFHSKVKWGCEISFVLKVKNFTSPPNWCKNDQQ